MSYFWPIAHLNSIFFNYFDVGSIRGIGFFNMKRQVSTEVGDSGVNSLKLSLLILSLALPQVIQYRSEPATLLLSTNRKGISLLKADACLTF